MEQPNYYAIIPANVRYDKNLSDKAKLLYGEITTLTKKEGFCWATNKYFAELYSTSERTISRILAELVQNGYIATTESIKKETVNGVDNFVKCRQICLVGIDKNVCEGVDKNVASNNTSNNNNIPPIPPKRGNARKAKQDDSVLEILSAYECSDELRQALLDFMEERKKKRKPVSDRALKLLLRELDTLSSQEKEKIAIIEQSIMNGWQGIFPLDKRKQQPANELDILNDLEERYKNET